MKEIDMSKIGKVLDFNTVLFMQINRVMDSMTSSNQNLLSSIEALEVLLYPFSDEIFEENTERFSSSEYIENIRNDYIKKRGIHRKDFDNDDMNTIIFISAKKKAKELMKLAQRQNLLPATSITEEIK